MNTNRTRGGRPMVAAVLMAATAAAAAPVRAAESTPTSFASFGALEDHFDEKLQEAQKKVEALRLTALEKFLPSAPPAQRGPVLARLIVTAGMLEQYEKVVGFSDTFLAAYAASPEAWHARSARYGALIELGRHPQAYAEWKATGNKVSMETWEQVFEAGLQIADGYADLGDIKPVKEIYDLLRQRLPFVSDLDMVLGPKAQSLFWVGKPLPKLEGADLAGKPVDLKEYQGKVLLIDFWATNCPPCIASLPDLIETYRRYHDRGFEVLGISLDTDVKMLGQFVQEQRIPWRQICDGKSYRGPIARRFDVTAIPSTFLVDRSGKIVRSGVPWRGFGPVVERLLAKPAASK